MVGLWKRSVSSRRNSRSCRVRGRARLLVEHLESRTLLTVFTPSQIRHAYGVDNLSYDGTGQTIALVIAYDNPTIAADLHSFDTRFGLPDPNLTVATPQGQPAYNAGWAQESALDVEWAHSLAPGADILLVEARSNSNNDLYAAVDYARNYPGVSVISMSWGGPESSFQSAYNFHFTTPADHNGVTFVAASGDSGGRTSYPSTSPNVVSIGGTRLLLSGSTYSSESGWTGSGGGPSSVASNGTPDYQQGWQSSGRRTTPDVSSVADPNTGVYVVFRGGLYQFGGTSASAPQWAGIIALADQGLSDGGYDTLDGPGQTLPALYGIAANDYATYGDYDGIDYHDITTGRAGSYSAGAGYDYVTGLGSPVADGLVPDLITWVTGSAPTPGSGAPSAGNSIGSVAAATAKQPRGQNGKTAPAPGIQAFLDGAQDPSLFVGTNAGTRTISSVPVITDAAGRSGIDAHATALVEVTGNSARFTPVFAARLARSGVEVAGGDLQIRTDDGTGDQTPALPAATDLAPGQTPEAHTGLIGTDLMVATIRAREAHDLCFAGDQGFATSAEQGPAPLMLESYGPAPDSLAAVAGLTVVLGSYWGGAGANAETSRRRRIPALPNVK